MKTRPEIVCLCGSTRFYETFQRVNYEETMAGRIVLSIGFAWMPVDGVHGEAVACSPDQKLAMDELHMRKIDIADRVHVLNVGGYIGDSTMREIAYTLWLDKKLTFLSEEAGELCLQDNTHKIGAMMAKFSIESKQR